MNTTTNKLFQLALQAYNNAYAPYSKFLVGAAILSTNGNYFYGCNVENISYPCGSCAEQSAISAMIAYGDQNIAEILIIADSSELITPCGACCQRIKEFSTPDTIITCCNLQGTQKQYTINQLLPNGFAIKELKHD